MNENIKSSGKDEITPSQYFEFLKGRKQTVTEEDLLKIYNNCLLLLNKYKITGQIEGMKKLIFHLKSIEAEREIVKMGITTFIYKDDMERYIEKIAKDTVKIIELERYEREIPDEIVNIIEKVKGKFDKLYVVFTDYTGKIERKIEKGRREKDPILFGVFTDPENDAIIDRFYFLGDWEDEYCDLTLDKMVNEVKKSNGRSIAITITTPKDIEELKKQLYQLTPNGKSFKLDPRKKENIFGKIRSFLNGGKNEE